MSNSPLVCYTRLSPNHSGRRNHEIDTISIHCMAGNLSVEGCGNLFSNPERNASSNYGIDSDGRIGLYVDEANRSWCTSSRSNDNRAITIEVANIENQEPWRISGAAYKSLINLLVDICQRNGIEKLLWKGDKSLIGHVDQQNMTVHRWFAAKSCPGNWLYEHHGQIAAEVNRRLNNESEEDEDMDLDRFKELWHEMRKELQDNDSGEWSREAREWVRSVGIVAGSSSEEFNGMWADVLTREQMAVMLYRFAKLVGLV